MDYPKCEIPKKNCLARDENGVCKLHTVCQKIIDKCVGCNKVENGYCSVYINPSAKWRIGGPSSICPMASHVIKESIDSTKVRAGQQKQSKKGKKKKK